MRRIREERNVTIVDIHEETRISTDIIRSFEEHGLLRHPRFNEVYLRSFVRSYASSIGIDADAALSELERALAGDYTNQLAVQYLGEDSESAAEEAHAPADAAAVGDRDEASSEAKRTLAPEGEEDKHVRAEGENRRGLLWIGVGVVLLTVAVVLGWLLFGASGTDETEAPPPSPQEQQSESLADTAATVPVDTAEEEPDPSAAPVLGDTLFITVIAMNTRINPIRVERDDDLRRPYYIEPQAAAVFPVRERIVLEQELDSVQVLLNGYPYPTDRRDAEGRVVITREVAQAFLDTAQAAAVSIPAGADTFAVGGP